MAKKVNGITVEIGGDTSKLGKALGDVNKQSRSLQTELKGVNTMLKYDPKNVTLVQQKQDILTKSVENTREKLKTLKDAQAQVQAQFDKGEITEQQYRDFQREIIHTENELKKYEKQLSEVSKEHRTFGETMENASKKLKEGGEKAIDIGKGLSLKLTAPIVGLSIASSKLGIDFEKAMSEVAAASGASAEELEALEKSARDAGATTNKSARDAADALKFMALAGWDVETSQKALMPMLKLSSAANMDLGRTAGLVTDTMSALGLEIGDMDGYLDILAQTSRNSNTDVDQLGEAFLTVGGRLKLLKAPLDESSTALGILANNGIKGSEAGRGLNAILTNLTAPTGRAEKALKELGVSAFDSAGEFIGIEKTLEKVESATKDMTLEQKNMYYSMIAGKEHGKTFNALLDSLGGGFTDLKGKVSGADGALNDMYDTATDNTAGAIDNLKSALEELSLKIFDSLQPTIEKLVEIVQGLTDWFNNLSPGMQNLIVKIALVVASIGPMLIIFGKIAVGISSIISLFTTLAPIFAAVKVAIAAISLPMVILVAKIAAVIAIVVAIIAVIKNWGAISDWLVEKWNQFIEWITPVFEKLGEFIGGIFEAIKEAIVGAIKFAIDFVVGYVKFLYETYKKILTTVWNFITGVFNGIKNTITNLTKGAIDTAVKTFNGLIDKVKKIFTKVKDTITGLMNIDLGKIGGDIIKGLVDGINGGIKWVKDAVSNVGKTISNGFKNFFNINSPSKLMRDTIGKSIPQGIAVGINADTDEALDAVDEMNRKIMHANEPDQLSMMRGRNTFGTEAQLQRNTASETLSNKMDRLVGVFETTLNKLTNPNYQVVLESGVIVGELKNDIDRELGREQERKERGG